MVAYVQKKHFFISDDSDWNIDMAKRFLMQREEKRINNKSKLYIKISNDARKKYFENWADDLNKKLARKIEIHFFDDSLLIARKFIENNPMYECIKKKKQPEKPYFEFGTRLKVLIIGFGEYGHAILDHIVCDSQYLACDTKGENKKRVKFSADIIEKDMQKCKYYESRLPDVCKRFNYKFIQNIADIQTAEFYDFMKEEINNYDRIVVALGNDYLNLECGIVLETIARKSVMLNSKKEIDELEEFKNKIFILQEKNIPQCENNLFTIFGNLDTIFTNEVITDEAMDEQAKLVNYVYEYIYSNEKTYKEDLPRMPKESLDWGKRSMFDRASSRASAAGIRNLVYLGLEENSNLDAEGWFSKLKREKKIKLDFMAETEHLRWMAFELLQGYEKWENVSSDLLKRANQTTKFCRHAALVEFDNLKSIDKKFKANIPLQEIDYYLVQCAMWIKNQE